MSRASRLKFLLRGSANLSPLRAATGETFVFLGYKERPNHFAEGLTP